MGIFRQFPYTNFHDLNTDWLINKVQDMLNEMFTRLGIVEKKVDDFIIDTESLIKEEVDTWLDEHPEATTTVQDGSLTREKFTPELSNELPSAYKDLYFQPLDVEKVTDLYIPTGHYAQGATCDGSGNMYVFYEVSSGYIGDRCLVKYNLNNVNIYEELYFTNYPNVGHGNSVAYDNINNVIVVMSSNGYVTLVNSSMQVVNQYYLGAADTAYRYSEIALNDDYLILNRSGSNSFYFYKRISDKIFGMYAVGTYQLGRGNRNILQDCFIYENNVIAMSSGSAYNTYLSVIGVNTSYVTTYRIMGLNKELEGCFVIDRDAYFVDADGALYTCKMPSVQVGAATAENPNIVPNYNRHMLGSAYYLSAASDLFEEISNAEGSPYTYKISRVVPNVDSGFYNKMNCDPERVTVAGWNSFAGARVTNGSLRIEASVTGINVHILYTVQSNNTQVLSSIVLLSDGSYRTISFATDGSDFHTKVASLFDNTQTIYLPDNISLTITPYGHNKTGDAIASFFGILPA